MQESNRAFFNGGYFNAGDIPSQDTLNAAGRGSTIQVPDCVRFAPRECTTDVPEVATIVYSVIKRQLGGYLLTVIENGVDLTTQDHTVAHKTLDTLLKKYLTNTRGVEYKLLTVNTHCTGEYSETVYVLKRRREKFG